MSIEERKTIERKITLDRIPSFLKHGENVMPTEELGVCNFEGCKNEAVYVCFHRYGDPKTFVLIRATCCGKNFCDEHAVKHKL